MTDQPTNPLVAGKSKLVGKADVAFLQAGVEKLNAVCAANYCPWRFTVAPNGDDKMSIQKVFINATERPAPPRDVMDRRGERMTAADTELLNMKLEHYGTTARYREDGSKYHVQRQAA